METKCFIKVFKFDTQTHKYNLIDIPIGEETHYNGGKLNIYINSDGLLIEINVKFNSKPVHKKAFMKNVFCGRIDQTLTISLPKSLLYKELLDNENEMERLL